MRIGWMHDFSLEQRPGGAQLTNEGVIQAAPEWAEVVRCYPGAMKEADAYILNNVKFFSKDELARGWASKYIVYEHDHWDTPQEWQRDWIGPIMNAAEAVIFLSPLHASAFKARHQVTPRQEYLVPSVIDVTQFAPGPDPHGTIWLGEWHRHKGIGAACRWAAKNGPVDFYGWGPCPPQGRNITQCGPLAYEDVPATLARYERFLFLPEWTEPFGRTVAEAALSVREMVCNERVGALSWGWQTREEWVEGLQGAAHRFWDIIGELWY